MMVPFDNMYTSKNKLLLTCVSAYLAYCIYENFLQRDGKSIDVKRNNRKYKTRGIKRTNGVTCYLNCVFLLLSNSPKFITYLNETMVLSRSMDGETQNDVLKLHQFIFDVFQQLLIDQDGEDVSKGLFISREKIHELERLINHSLLRQNDWLEILGRIIEVMDLERKNLNKIVSNSQKIQFPFEFESKISTYCVKCRQQAELGSQLNKPDNEDLFLFINLDFAFKKDEYKNLGFSQIIEKNMYEQIEKYSCSYCTVENYKDKTDDKIIDLKTICINSDIDQYNIPSKYDVKTTLIKRREITKYPSLLFFNLNRFSYNHYGISTRDTDTYYIFDKDMKINENKYQLRSLIKHAGNAKLGGHYQIFNRKPMVIKKKIDDETMHDLKYKPFMFLDESPKKHREIDLGSDLAKDFWLINDDKVREKSLDYDISPYDSNMIVGLVYET